MEAIEVRENMVIHSDIKEGVHVMSRGEDGVEEKEGVRQGCGSGWVLVPLPALPLPLPLPKCSTNTSSYPTHQDRSGQSLPHPYLKGCFLTL